MCSRYICHLDLSENPNTKKGKNMQVKYPAPFSQSWSGPVKNSMKTSTNRNSTQKLGNVRRDTRPHLQYRGPDPTLPHLKYGVFPKRMRAHPFPVVSSADQFPRAMATNPRTRTSKEGASSPPVIVACALDTRRARRLTRTASMHIDIEPKHKGNR